MINSLENLFSRTIRKKNGCMEWQGTKGHNGYGLTSLKNKKWRAHRLVWFFIHGDPGKNFICHRCDNPSCINIEHLFIGTRSDNMTDASNKKRLYGQRKTHCVRGHKYTEENTVKQKSGRRRCRTCNRERQMRDRPKWKRAKEARERAQEGGDSGKG